MAKYILGDNTNILLLIDNYPENKVYFDNSPVEVLGRGIAIKIKPYCKDDVEIVMDEDQAKAIIKGLKKQIKILRKG